MTKRNKEVRRLRSHEMRVSGDGNTLSGYIAVFNSPSEDLGYTEILAPGCFTRSLASGNDIVALINHDDNAPVGRTSAGTLHLAEDDKGLAYTIQLPNTTRAADLKESVKRGDLTGCSFGFVCTDDAWDAKSLTRTIRDVELIEVSVGVTFPAYTDTTSQLRSLPATTPVDIRKKIESRDTEDGDEPCTCPCPECVAGDCADCSDPDCACDGCTCNQDDDAEENSIRALVPNQCVCICPQCRAGSCGICSADPQCEGAERNSLPDWYERTLLEIDLD